MTKEAMVVGAFTSAFVVQHLLKFPEAAVLLRNLHRRCLLHHKGTLCILLPLLLSHKLAIRAQGLKTSAQLVAGEGFSVPLVGICALCF